MKKLFILIPVLFLLTGCRKIENYYAIDSIVGLTNDKNKSFYITIDDDEKINTKGDAFKTAFKEATTDEKARDELLSKIILLSDNTCEKYKGKILSTSAAWNVGLGTTSTIFSGLATFVGGDLAKSSLSAGAAFTNSAKSLIKNEVYYNTFAIAIIKAIDRTREAKRLQIQNGMNQNATEYTITQGILDINSYHNLCSFQNGLKVVAESVDRRKLSAAELKEKVKYIENQIKNNEKMNSDIKKSDISELGGIKSDSNITIDNTELIKQLKETQLRYLNAPY
ncbi:MAG: hypothetical protein JRJ44_07240 [Deltaproteobacteria bacterium]|nr:hypothetical protein [Deltaproteobacteria bacterium]